MILLCQFLGRFCHRESTAGIAQCFPQTVLERSGRTEPKAPASAPHDVRSLAHRLGSAGQHQLGLPEHDLLRCLCDGLEAGATETVDRHGRSLYRSTRPKSYMTGQVDGISRGLEHIAEDDMVHRLWLNPASFKCGFCGDSAQIR